jgi:hypothetical protein
VCMTALAVLGIYALLSIPLSTKSFRTRFREQGGFDRRASADKQRRESRD